VRSDGVSADWIHARFDGSGVSEIIETGPIAGLDLTPGASNFIGLSVAEGMGIIIVNGPDPVASFAVETPAGTGDLTRWMSFESADPADASSFVLATDEFYVWDLGGMPRVLSESAGAPASEEPADAAEDAEPVATEEPEAADSASTPEAPEPTVEPTTTSEIDTADDGDTRDESADVATPRPPADPQGTPAAPSSTSPSTSFDIRLGERVAGPELGELTESETAIDYAVLDVDLADFYAIVEFVIPLGNAVPWDFTVGFRDTGEPGHYRFTLISDGTWFYDNGPVIDAGDLGEVLLVPGEIVTLEVFAEGERGAIALNGVQIAELDLSENLSSGEIWIATARSFDTTSIGRTIAYRDFQVFEVE
jgi:hypothetical protein